ncbi:nudix hydrolase [Nannochloropsis gaditana]|uniref:Nudix hydrolase n=2 Tax=Nannochloropsis gaditana TaxID=72520 RepID=W7TEP9_9STRA|nr:nudix hydrolase [Nannochloropsis gaditana]
MSLSADEIVDIVDESNQVLRQERREIMRKERLLHRSTYIFARNSQGEYYVQKRTMLKDYCPGYYEVVAGGVVGAGETYAENADREAEEELGIPPSAGKKHLFTFLYQDERIRVFGDAWEVVWDGALTLQKEEVESVHPMTLEEVFIRVEAGDKFTPDSLYATRKYLDFLREKGEKSNGN